MCQRAVKIFPCFGNLSLTMWKICEWKTLLIENSCGCYSKRREGGKGSDMDRTECAA